MAIAVIGGTGPQGRGLAQRCALAGIDVVVGSRDAVRAAEIAADLSAGVPGAAGAIAGAANADAVARAEKLVVLAVPWSAHRATLAALTQALQGKILVDMAVPLADGNPRKAAMPSAGSATEAAQAMLGAEVAVVGALHNVSAHVLAALDHADQLRHPRLRRRPRGAAHGDGDDRDDRRPRLRLRPGRERALHRGDHPAAHPPQHVQGDGIQDTPA